MQYLDAMLLVVWKLPEHAADQGLLATTGLVGALDAARDDELLRDVGVEQWQDSAQLPLCHVTHAAGEFDRGVRCVVVCRL